MTLSWQRLAIVGLALVALGGGSAVLAALRLPIAADTVGAPPPAAPAASTAPAAFAVPAAAVPASGLFRPSRSPAPLAFDPLGQPAGAPVVESRPALALLGLVLGASRAAVIRGLPGYEGARVMSEDEEHGGVRIMSIDSLGATVIWRGERLRLELTREGQ